MENTIIDALNALVTKMGGNSADNKMILDALNDIVDNYTGGSSLPTVTAEDNGKVLSVVDGEWNKAEAQGGDSGTFIVGQSLAGSTFTLEKTFAEIDSALRSGKIVLVKMNDYQAEGEAEITYAPILSASVGNNYMVSVMVVQYGDIGVFYTSWSYTTNSADGYPQYVD